MDIKEFVSETLQQIADGVSNAQIKKEGKNAVNLDFVQRKQKVAFDVAVTVVEGTETGGKAGISVWSIGAGVSTKTDFSSSTVSRIKFEIPIILPEVPH